VDSTRMIAIGQALGVLILLSLGTVLMKMALFEVHPLTFGWVSVAIGMILLSFYTFVLRGERIPRGLSWEVWYYIFAIGICNFVISRLTMTFALERLPAITNAYLTNFIGFITMGMSIFILKETPRVWQIVGAVVALLGLRVFFAEMPTTYELVGVILVLIGITAVAYTNNVARKLAMVTNYQLSNGIISTVAIMIGGTIMIAFGLIYDGVPTINSLTNWAILLYSGGVMMAFCLTVWNYVLRTLRSYEASILGASTVIWTTLLAIPILGEQLTLNQAAGMALMIAGLALVQVRSSRLPTLRRPRRQPLPTQPMDKP
jgi:drug/metabolite transporter (DMT)-like permease